MRCNDESIVVLQSASLLFVALHIFHKFITE